MSIFFAIGLFGCADFTLGTEGAVDGVSDTGGGGDDTDNATETGDADVANYVAAWYTLSATLAIREGIASAENADIHFVLGDATLDRRDCDPLDSAALAVVTPPPDGTYAEWSLAIPAETGCTARDLVLPAAIAITIGPLDDEVRAQLGTVELDAEAAHLWGAAFSADAGPFHAFGYAKGAADADAAVAPPDGEYTMEPLLLQPVPVAE